MRAFYAVHFRILDVTHDISIVACLRKFHVINTLFILELGLNVITTYMLENNKSLFLNYGSNTLNIYSRTKMQTVLTCNIATNTSHKTSVVYTCICV